MCEALKAADPPLDLTEWQAPMQATRTCSVEGCDRDMRKREWCTMHYQRWRAYGTTDLIPVPSVADRLAAGLERKPNGCLEWTKASVPAGYGCISVNGTQTYTHRLAWELANGPIPKGMVVRHIVCDNPPCANVAHLALGTDADNIADKIAKGRDRNGNEDKARCKHGHPFDETNTYLSPQGKRQCRLCAAANRARHEAKRGPRKHRAVVDVGPA